MISTLQYRFGPAFINQYLAEPVTLNPLMLRSLSSSLLMKKNDMCTQQLILHFPAPRG